MTTKEFLTEGEVFNTPYGEKRIVVTRENHLQWCGFTPPLPRERVCIQRKMYNGDSERWKGKHPKCAFRIVEPHHVGAARLCFVNRVGGQWVPEYIDFKSRNMMAIVRFPWGDYTCYNERDFSDLFQEVL